MLSFLLFINTNKQTFFKGHTLFEKENPFPGLFRSIFLSHHFFCKSFLINELHNCQIRVNAFRSALLILYSSSFLNIMNKMTHQFKHSVIWFPFFPNDIFWLCYHIWKLVGQSKFRICTSWVFFLLGLLVCFEILQSSWRLISLCFQQPLFQCNVGLHYQSRTHYFPCSSNKVDS